MGFELENVWEGDLERWKMRVREGLDWLVGWSKILVKYRKSFCEWCRVKMENGGVMRLVRGCVRVRG